MRLLFTCIMGVLGCILPLQNAVAQSAAIGLRSNAPRFLRLGDRLELQFIIRNNTPSERTGKAELQLTDASTGTSIDGWFQNAFPNQYFTAVGSDSAVVRFPIEVPYQFYKTAAWRFIVRTGTDTAAIQGRIPILALSPQQHAAMVINKSGSYQFTPLQQSKENEAIQHAGLQWQVAASPRPFAYAALPNLLNADAPPTIKTAHAVFATALHLQLMHNNPDAARQIANDLGWDRENGNVLNTELLQQQLNEQIESLIKTQQKTGAFSLWPGGQPDVLATQIVTIALGRLLQLKALPENVQQALCKRGIKALQYLEKGTQDDQSKLQLAYIHSLYDSFPKQAPTGNELIAQIGKLDAAASAMAATLLWRRGDTATARKFNENLPVSIGNVENDRTNPLQHPIIQQSLLLEAATLTGSATATIDSMSRNLLAAKEAQGWPTPEATAAAVFALLRAYQQPLEAAPLISIQLGNIPLQNTVPNSILATQNLDAVRIHAALGNISLRVMNSATAWCLLQWRYFTEPATATGTIHLSRQWTIVSNGQRTPLLDGTFIKAGDVVEVALEIDAAETLEHLQLRHEWPAGMTSIIGNATTPPTIDNTRWVGTSASNKTWWIQKLPKGKHRFVYQLKAMHTGTFSSGPAVLRSAYNQKEISRAEGIKISIE